MCSTIGCALTKCPCTTNRSRRVPTILMASLRALRALMFLNPLHGIIRSRTSWSCSRSTSGKQPPKSTMIFDGAKGVMDCRMHAAREQKEE